ncbi:hypothetical protein C1G86_0967 [Dehalococcoides mccartyi]|nr:hypothetical protein C1G86_0967 [Dehalococcoides mccartyi]
MMSRQMGQAPPEVRDAVARVEVVIKKGERDFELRMSHSDSSKVEEMTKQSIESWVDLLSRGFQAVGYKVKIYE